jgi:hypothetical protein
MDLGASKFDRYDASIPDADPRQVTEWINRHLAKTYDGDVIVEGGNGMHSFEQRLTWKGAEDKKQPQLLMLQWGGRPMHPHVTQSGHRTPEFVTPFRAAYPVHRVSRVDVAIDGRRDGLWEDTFKLFDSIAKRDTRIAKNAQIYSFPHNRDHGDSYRLGADTSSWQVMAYEKGKERFSKTGDPAWRLLFDVVRMESRFWPEKSFKDRAAGMASGEFWGCSPILRELARKFMNLDPEPVTMKETRTADHERAMAWVAQQAGPTLLRELARQGGDIIAWASTIIDMCEDAAKRPGEPERGTMLHASELRH